MAILKRISDHKTDCNTSSEKQSPQAYLAQNIKIFQNYKQVLAETQNEFSVK